MARETPTFLSSEWINERLENVMDQVTDQLWRILFGGLLHSCIMPFEKPLSPEDIMRMTPVQRDALINAASDPLTKQKLQDVVRSLAEQAGQSLQLPLT